MLTKAIVFTTVALLLAACEQHAPGKSEASAKPAPAEESASFKASDAVTRRFGAGVFTHDVVEDETKTGTAACGYYSPKSDTKTGSVFVFADGKLVTDKDVKSDAFSALVSQKCPDFVLRPNL